MEAGAPVRCCCCFSRETRSSWSTHLLPELSGSQQRKRSVPGVSEVQLSAGLVLGAACKPLTPRLGPVKHTQTRGAGKAAELPEALQCLDRTVPGQSPDAFVVRLL